jgi:hypothetical protein
MRFDHDNDDHRVEDVYECKIEKGVKKVKQLAWLVRKVYIRDDIDDPADGIYRTELKPNEPEKYEITRTFVEKDFINDNEIMWLELSSSNES